jgi:uncharacterized membrane protein YkvA (DUF1232 family)
MTDNLPMKPEHKDFYRRLRAKIKAWAESRVGKENKYIEYVLLAPDMFYLLVKLALDDDVPADYKIKLGAAIAYFISPIDLIPEGLFGPIGYLDDVVLAAYVINLFLNENDAAIVKRHWAGDGDVLEQIRALLDKAKEILGERVWGEVKSRVNREEQSDADERRAEKESDQ